MKLNTIRKARRDLLNTLKEEAKSRSANALIFVDHVYSGLDLEDTWTNVRKVAFEGEEDKLGNVKDFYKDNGVSAAVASVMYERMTKALRARFELKSKAKTLGGLVAVYDRHYTETAAESRGEEAGNRKGSAPKAADEKAKEPTKVMQSFFEKIVNEGWTRKECEIAMRAVHEARKAS